MRGRLSKVSVLFLALVLALGGIGAAFAAWTDTLTIGGTVDTGSLMLGFTELTCAEKYEYPRGSEIYLDGEWEGKEVGSFTCELEDLKTNPLTGLMGYGKGVVTITNAYPCYRVHMTFVVKNLGTIPVRIQDLVISDPTGELEWDPAGFLWKDFNGDTVYNTGEEIMSFELVNLVGVQLHTGDKDKAEVDVHLKQPAEQGHTYTFLVEITGIQWNKYGEP